MTDGKAHRYIWVVEWDESVVKPSVIVTHRITLLPEVRVDDFEQFMIMDAFERLGEVRTRAGRVARQSRRRPASRTQSPSTTGASHSTIGA